MKWYYTLLFIATALPPATSGGDIKLTSWPSIVLKEGETAEVPCLTSGEGDILMWRKGEYFNTSKYVISRADDNDATREPTGYSISPRNGNLLIANVTFEDEGRYYCRIASDKNDCNVGVSVYVQDRQSSVFIEECHPLKSCVLLTDEITSPTCTAQFVSAHTVLKWYNESRELASESQMSTSNNSRSINISSILTGSFGEYINLKCTAVDERIGFITEGMSASVGRQLGGKDQAVWLYTIISIIIIVCGLVIAALVFWKLRNKEKNITTENDAEESQPMTSPSPTELNTKTTQEANRSKFQNQQLQVLYNRSKQFKTNFSKVDPGLLLRLKDTNIVKEAQLSWSAYIYSKIYGDSPGVEKDLETLSEVSCVEETESLKSNSIEEMQYLFQNSVDGLHSCIILCLEKGDSQNWIIESLQAVCTELYNHVSQLEENGFTVVVKMRITRLDRYTLVNADKVPISPKIVDSKEQALEYISAKFSPEIPLALDFHLSSTIDTFCEVTGHLKLVVLDSIESLDHAFYKQPAHRQCKLVDSKEPCKVLIVLDGGLGDGPGKIRIGEVVKKIQSFRVPL